MQDEFFINRYRLRWLLLAAWMTFTALMLWHTWSALAPMRFSDPDDALRMVEVRSWMAGQGWFDVSQHRVNPPAGGAMHWSRLLDIPMAIGIALLKPLLGLPWAERVVIALYPPMLYGLVMLFVALVIRRMTDRPTTIVGIGLVMLGLTIGFQFRPLRIDHHGAQILMGAIALWASLSVRTVRSGLIVGLAVAMWMHISNEGLPYAVLFGAVFGLRALYEEAQWPRLSTYLAVLATASVALLFGVRGWTEAQRFYCDSFSPVHLLPLIGAAVAVPLMASAIGTGTWVRRLLVLGLSAAVAGGVFLWTGAPCRGDPFAGLDPFVRQYWYVNVKEGQPVWLQTFDMMPVNLVPSLLGMIGTLLAVRFTRDPHRRLLWIQILLLLIGALAVSVLVLRAMSVAHLFALPGTTWMLVAVWRRIQRLSSPFMRVPASLVILLFVPVIAIRLAWLAVPAEPEDATTNASTDAISCGDPTVLRRLNHLPPGLIFAPLDVGPMILVATPHSVIATGHHRNNDVMHKVMAAFMSKPDEARHLIADTTRADYVFICRGTSESDMYIKHAGSFAALMAKTMDGGKPPSWLQRVPMRPGMPFALYRVIR